MIPRVGDELRLNPMWVKEYKKGRFYQQAFIDTWGNRVIKITQMKDVTYGSQKLFLCTGRNSINYSGTPLRTFLLLNGNTEKINVSMFINPSGSKSKSKPRYIKIFNTRGKKRNDKDAK